MLSTRLFMLTAILGAATQVVTSQCTYDHYEPVQFAPLFAEKGINYPQKITTTLNGVVVSSDYDNGSLGGMTYGGISNGRQVFNGSLHTDQGELGTAVYWFRFTMDNVANGQYRINLSHVQNDFPVIRFYSTANGQWSDWRRLTPSETPSNTSMEFDTTADQDLVELAFFYPLGVQETYDAVNALADASPHATVSTPPELSFRGNDFQSVTVNDTRFPDSEKHGIWVHSRAHAGEVTSTWLLLGYLEQFTANDEIGARLRRYCRLDMLTLLNVDGVDAGNTRWDTQGVDPERWADISTPGSSGCLMRSPGIPSQLLLKRLIDERLASVAPPEVALNLHSTQGRQADSFFFQRNLGGQAGVQQSFRTILQNYVDAFDNATPLFDNRAPAFSNLNNCFSTSSSKYVESYFYTQRGEATMAMTHEGTYQNRGYGDFGYWTAEEYKELGRAQARALIEYLDLPECDPVSPSVFPSAELSNPFQAGDGIEIQFDKSSPDLSVNVYAGPIISNIDPVVMELVGSEITGSSFTYDPGEDGIYEFRFEAATCDETFTTDGFTIGYYYNDIENSEFATPSALSRGQVKYFPMTDSVNITLTELDEISPFNTPNPVVVSRNVGPADSPVIDSSKVINEQIIIRDSIDEEFVFEWKTSPTSNPDNLVITTMYFQPAGTQSIIEYSEVTILPDSTFSVTVDADLDGTWLLGEAGANINYEASINLPLTLQASVGDGMDIFFTRNIPDFPIDLYAKNVNFPPATSVPPFQLVASGITETSYNYTPAEGDGVYSFAAVAQDQFGNSEAPQFGEVQVYYNDVENSELELFIIFPFEPMLFPMTDDAIIVINENLAEDVPLRTVVSRSESAPNTPLLDSSKLINEQINIESQLRFVRVDWYYDEMSNPNDLEITTAYVVLPENRGVRSYSVPIAPTFPLLSFDLFRFEDELTGTWYLGEAGAIIVNGNTWVFTE